MRTQGKNKIDVYVQLCAGVLFTPVFSSRNSVNTIGTPSPSILTVNGITKKGAIHRFVVTCHLVQISPKSFFNFVFLSFFLHLHSNIIINHYLRSLISMGLSFVYLQSKLMLAAFNVYYIHLSAFQSLRSGHFWTSSTTSIRDPYTSLSVFTPASLLQRDFQQLKTAQAETARVTDLLYSLKVTKTKTDCVW